MNKKGKFLMKKINSVCGSWLFFRNIFINMQPNYLKTFHESNSTYFMNTKLRIHILATMEIV